jgi:hypothetical protein
MAVAATTKVLISPKESLEAWPRIELGYADLQSAASPLRHQAVTAFGANP